MVKKWFTAIRELVAYFAQEKQPIVAVYPSAGYDSFPFVYLHKEFLESRHFHEPAPNLFIFVDRIYGLKKSHCSRSGPPLRLSFTWFKDARTCISINSMGAFRLAEKWGCASEIIVDSDTFGSSTTILLKLESENLDFFRLSKEEEFTPDYFIRVCDGCRLGGNRVCFNSLRRKTYDTQFLQSLSQAPYHIVDHLSNYCWRGRAKPGDIIKSQDSEYPLAYKYLTLLSRNWGSYAHRAMIPGSSLLEKMPDFLPP